MSNNKLAFFVMNKESRYCHFKWKTALLLEVPHGTFTER